MAKYKVRPGFTHGAQKQYKAGDTVELTEQEAAGFLDKLELVTSKEAHKPTGNENDGIAQVEKQLEAETGKDFQETPSDLPTLAETLGKEAPKAKK